MATRWRRRGRDLETLRRQLGHASMKTTQVYLAADPAHEDAEILAFDRGPSPSRPTQTRERCGATLCTRAMLWPGGAVNDEAHAPVPTRRQLAGASVTPRTYTRMSVMRYGWDWACPPCRGFHGTSRAARTVLWKNGHLPT